MLDKTWAQMVELQLMPCEFADGEARNKVFVHRGVYEQFKGILQRCKQQQSYCSQALLLLLE